MAQGPSCPCRPGRREVPLRQARRLDPDPRVAGQLPAAPVQPDPAHAALPLVLVLRAIRDNGCPIPGAAHDHGRTGPRLRFRGSPAAGGRWRPKKYPSVDVFLPVCGEPVDVVRNTWKYVAEMSRHYQGTVTAYVLDDSASPELKAMAREFGFAYARRPNRGWFKKWETSGSASRFPMATTSSSWTLTSRRATTCSTRPCRTWRTAPRSGSCKPPSSPDHQRPELGGTRRRRRPGAVLPVHPDGPVPQGRGDLRRELRSLPAGRAQGEPGHDAGRALRGRAHRLRPERIGWSLRYIPVALLPATVRTTSPRS